MDNEQIARRFNSMAALMEIRGEDPFRLRSYRMAAEAIETWPTPVEEIAAQEGIAGLQEIPGVGKALAGKIVDLVNRGTFDAWERLIEFIDGGGLETVDGIGPKTAERIKKGLNR